MKERERERERERDEERETGDALKCCLSEDVSYPRERSLVNRRGRLGTVATISHPLLALVPRAIDCRLARLVGIVFEYVAYLLSGSLLASIVRT